jgi:hypothetical protein
MRLLSFSIYLIAIFFILEDKKVLSKKRKAKSTTTLWKINGA